MTDALSLREAAAAARLHYDTFREVWPAMVRDTGFPAPFKVGKRWKWDGEAIDDWKRTTSASLADSLRRPKPANDVIRPLPIDPNTAALVRVLDRQRDEIARMMGGHAR